MIKAPSLGSVFGDFIVDELFLRLWSRQGSVVPVAAQPLPLTRHRAKTVADMVRGFIRSLPSGARILPSDAVVSLRNADASITEFAVQRAFRREDGRSIRKVRHGIYEVTTGSSYGECRLQPANHPTLNG